LILGGGGGSERIIIGFGFWIALKGEED